MGRIKSPRGFITSSLSREVYVRPRGQGVAQLSEGESLPLVARFERSLAEGVGALPHACGGSAPRGWIEPQ